MKNTIYILAVFALLIVGCTQQATDETITIGGIVPLTGDAAAIGEPIRQAVELGIDEVNANGGVNGKRLAIVWEDGACAGREAATAMQKLIAVDGVRVVIGGACSGESLAAIPIAEQNQVLMFSAASSSPELTGISDYFVRNYPSDASSAGKVAEAAYAAGDRRVAAISENTDYAQAYKDVFVVTLTELGGTIVVNENYEQDATDYRAQITKAVAANPDGIFLSPQLPANLGLLLKQIREAGYTGQIYTNEFAGSPDVLTEYSAQAEGTVFATAFYDETSEGAQRLNDLLVQKYGKVPDALPPLYLAAAYDNPRILAEAMEACSETDTACMSEHIRSLKDWGGIAYPVTMSASGDVDFAYELRTVRDGAVVALE